MSTVSRVSSTGFEVGAIASAVLGETEDSKVLAAQPASQSVAAG